MLVDDPPDAEVRIAVECRRLGELVSRSEVVATRERSREALAVGLTIAPGSAEDAGYALTAVARGGAESATATSSFDVATHWSQAPRYGFLSDFSPAESDAESARRLDDALRLHLNALQFYDWMPNHYELVSTEEDYVDAQGRRLSRGVVTRRVDLCHERGIAALAYGALYGAERSFADAHPEWLLYDGARRPLHLADLYYIQDFSRSSGWREWIIRQYERAVAALGFDGIHIDQYGFPKDAWSRAGGSWRSVDVASEFVGFVEEAAARVLRIAPHGGSIFNCVNAWPLEQIAATHRDAATYIEVWEPHTRYRDLYELVRRARALRPDKNVILAAYLRPFHPSEKRDSAALNAFRLAFAAIHASGGSQLIAGEGRSLLSEAYYPRYGCLTDGEFDTVRRYFDFVVRNRELLDIDGPDEAWTHVGPTNEVITLSSRRSFTYCAGAVPGGIWTILRRRGDRVVLHLINLRGLEHDRWNSGQATPEALEDIEIAIRSTRRVSRIFWDSADDPSGVGQALSADHGGTDVTRVTVPRLDTWAVLTWLESVELL